MSRLETSEIRCSDPKEKNVSFGKVGIRSSDPKEKNVSFGNVGDSVFVNYSYIKDILPTHDPDDDDDYIFQNVIMWRC